MSKHRQTAGFGLVQMVVVVVIVGLLALFLLPKVMQYFEHMHEASFDKAATEMTTSLDAFKEKYAKEGHGVSVFEGFTMQPATGFPIPYNVDDCIKIADQIGHMAKAGDFYHQAGEGKVAFDAQYHALRTGENHSLKGSYAAVFETGVCHFYCLKHKGLDKFLTYDSTHAMPLTIVPFNHNDMNQHQEMAAPAVVQPAAEQHVTEMPAAPAEVVAPAENHVEAPQQPATH